MAEEEISEEDLYKILEKEQLHDAAAEGDLKKVKALLEQGYDVNAFDWTLHWTPLHHAVQEGHIKVAEYLLSVGADVNAYDEDNIGETPLGQVAEDCSFEIAELLINAGADPTIEGWMRITALYRASERKKTEGVRVYKLLLETARSKFHYKE